MENMMVYMIRLSKKKKESDFEKFMEDVVFPDIPKIQLRDGKIEGLVLLKGDNTGMTNQYLWFVYGGINGGAAGRSLDKVRKFGTRVTPLHMFTECARWFAEGQESKAAEILR